MATLHLTTPTALPEPADRGYWMFGRKSDLGWFVLSLLVPLVLYLPPYWLLGSKAIWPLYLVYVVGFATPHLWLTWAVTVPKTAHGMYSRKSIWLPVVLTLALVAAVPFTDHFGGWDLFFTAVTMYGYYHIYKQHLGLLHIYDAKYAQVHGDHSVFKDFAPFHQFCVLAFALPIFYVWTLPPFEVVVGIQRFRMIYPQIPSWALLPYLAWMGYYAFRTIRTLLRRRQEGNPAPTAHLSLAGTAALSYLVAFGVIPSRDYLLTLAIFITYHDLQYWGFVWNFQRQRSLVEAAAGTTLDFVHRLARDNRVFAYFGLSFAFSAAVVAVLLVSPPLVALGVVVFTNVVHYVMDGMVWQRRHNPKLHAHMGLQ